MNRFLNNGEVFRTKLRIEAVIRMRQKTEIKTLKFEPIFYITGFYFWQIRSDTKTQNDINNNLHKCIQAFCQNYCSAD